MINPLCLLPMVVGVWQPGAPTPVSTTIEGSLTVDGRVFPLKHAYALARDDVEGLRLKGEPRKTLLIQITDAPLPGAKFASWYACWELEQLGRLRAFEFEFDPERRKLLRTRVYLPIAQTEMRGQGITIVGKRESFSIKALKIGPRLVSGTMSMTKDDAFLWHMLEGPHPQKYRFSAEFSVPIRHQAKVTSIVLGEAITSTPQMHAVLAFESALQKGDVAAIREILAGDTRRIWERGMGIMGEAEYTKRMQTSMLTSAKGRSLVRMVVRGDKATITYNGRVPNSAWHLMKVGGVWTIGEECCADRQPAG